MWTDPSADQLRQGLPVKVAARFNAPPARVYACWVTPDEIKSWFGRPHCVITEVELDLKVGGYWRFRYSAKDWFEGTYTDIRTAEHLSFTWCQMQGGKRSPLSEVSVEFRNEKPGTVLIVRHSSLNTDRTREGVTAGWTSSLAELNSIMRSRNDRN